VVGPKEKPANGHAAAPRKRLAVGLKGAIILSTSHRSIEVAALPAIRALVRKHLLTGNFP